MEEKQDKICSKCKVLKPLLQFPARKGSKDGHRDTCFFCEEIRKEETRKKALAAQEVVGEKVCYKCNIKKSFADFGKRLDAPDGRRSYCRECDAAHIKVPRPKGINSKIVDLQNGQRICAKCNTAKPLLTDFSTASSTKGGRASWCKSCVNAWKRGYRNNEFSPTVEGKKTCERCCVEKDLKDFWIKRDSPDGRKKVCGACLDKNRIKKPSPIIDNLDGTRVCTKCHVTKPLLAFPVSLDTKLGRSGRCLECKQARLKSYHAVIEEKRYLVATGVKRCSTCKKEKPVSLFGLYKCSKDGRKLYCLDCSKDISFKWRTGNPKAVKAIRRRVHEKARININTKLTNSIRGMGWRGLHKGNKPGSGVGDLGCSVEYLKVYIESLWQPGMIWQNWNFFGWQLDHIIPLASFDLTDRDQYLKACNYKNLRPLWWQDNLAKGDKMPWEFTQPLSSGPAPRPRERLKGSPDNL